MQILIAAGFPSVGEAFPSRWGETIRDANPEGFYESVLRQGIYYATNPNPETGAYMFPEQVANHVVKVFIPGLVRTDRAFIGKVLATLRPWREYCASIDRLVELEDASRERPPPPRMPPPLEWWSENFMLIRDLTTRRYAVHVETFDRLLRQPEETIRSTLKWLGGGDVERAVAKVKPEHRTFDRPQVGGVPQQVAAVFDDLYAAVDGHEPIGKPLLDRLNQTHLQLLPEIQAHQERIQRALAPL